MGVVPCPVCGWQIPDHMARRAIEEGTNRIGCPNPVCGRALVRRRRGRRWGPWETEDGGDVPMAGI